MHSLNMQFNGLHPRNPCKYMDSYSLTNPEGIGGWVGLVRWLIAETLPTKWSHVNRRSGADHGKFASQRPTFCPLSQAAQCFQQFQPSFLHFTGHRQKLWLVLMDTLGSVEWLRKQSLTPHLAQYRSFRRRIYYTPWEICTSPIQ